MPPKKPVALAARAAERELVHELEQAIIRSSAFSCLTPSEVHKSTTIRVMHKKGKMLTLTIQEDGE